MSGADPLARALAVQARRSAAALRPAPYLGLVASRVNIPSLVNTSYKQLNFRRWFGARDDVTSLQVALPNWIANNTVSEGGTGGTAQFTAAIERLDGSVQPFAWSGAAISPVVADGAQTPLSDPLALATPLKRGEWFAVRGHGEFASGIALASLAASASIAGGDALEFAGSGLADKTQAGTIATQTATTFGPCLIVGITRRVTVAAFGDSRLKGGAAAPGTDTADGSGDLGEVARSLGPRVAYLNMGTASETLQAFLANNGRRLALAAYASHVVSNYGINDLIAGRTAAALLADMALFAALPAVAGKPIAWTTLGPRTTSSDAWATIANQTPFAAEVARVSVNDALRARRVAGIGELFDIAAACENAVNGGRHAIGSGGQALTADGLHLNALGCQAIVAARAVDAARLAR